MKRFKSFLILLFESSWKWATCRRSFFVGGLILFFSKSATIKTKIQPGNFRLQYCEMLTVLLEPIMCSAITHNIDVLSIRIEFKYTWKLAKIWRRQLLLMRIDARRIRWMPTQPHKMSRSARKCPCSARRGKHVFKRKTTHKHVPNLCYHVILSTTTYQSILRYIIYSVILQDNHKYYSMLKYVRRQKNGPIRKITIPFCVRARNFLFETCCVLWRVLEDYQDLFGRKKSVFILVFWSKASSSNEFFLCVFSILSLELILVY